MKSKNSHKKFINKRRMRRYSLIDNSVNFNILNLKNGKDKKLKKISEQITIMDSYYKINTVRDNNYFKQLKVEDRFQVKNIKKISEI